LKGAMMLHVVREQLGEDSLWFATLKNMHSDFAFKSVGTKEVLQYLKIHLGAKVVPIFEHYLNMTALPVLAVQKMKNKYEYMIQWYGVSPGFHMSVAFETKNGSELIEVGDSAKRFMFEKIKSKEPKVINSVGAFTLRYR
jgi:aminopeptidase N